MKKTIACVAAGSLCSVVELVLLAAMRSAAAAQATPPLVEWLAPAAPSSRPQSAEQQEAGKKFGRALPAPEFLQPSLDPALPAYQPGLRRELTGSMHGAASDVLPAVVKLWIARFKKYYPRVNIDVPPPYAGSLGAKELVQAKIDFVFVSRELKPDDIADFQAKFGYPPLSVPISGGSYRQYGFLDTIGFFVSKDNPLEKISFDQLDAIYSSTHHRGGAPITTWAQLGLTGEWADQPIHVYGIEPWNGFEEFIRQRVLSRDGKRGEWRKDIQFEKLVFPMAALVAKDRYGIGYSGLAYIDAGVKMLPINNGADAQFYAPNYENVALARYPLSRLIYMNVNKAPDTPLDPLLKEFLRFILSREGQQAVLDHAIYLPLRAQQADRSESLLGD